MIKWFGRLGAVGAGAVGARWSPADLFANGEQGSLWGKLPYYSDAAGTVEAEWGDPVGNIPDSSGNGTAWAQVTSTARPILGRVPVGGRRNLAISSDAQSWVGGGEVLVTPGIDDPHGGTEAYRCVGNSNLYRLNVVPDGLLAAFPEQQMTLTFWMRWVSGSPDIRLNGRVNVFTFPIDTSGEWTKYSVNTPDLGSGFQQIRLRQDQVVDIAFVQLELGTEETPYQRVGNEYDITEAGVKEVHYLRFDGTDDAVTTTLPAISGGTIVLAGTNGIWIDSLDFAGGEFSVGPDTYTGGPAGLMSILGDLLVGGGFVIDRALTPEEIAQVKGYYKARGAAGLFQWGDELVGDPEFDNPGYWSTSGNISVTGGQCVFDGVTSLSDYCYIANLLTYPGYFRAVWNVSSLSGGGLISGVGQGTGGSNMSTSEAGIFVHYAHLPEPANLNRLRIIRAPGETPVSATIDSVSLRKLEMLP